MTVFRWTFSLLSALLLATTSTFAAEAPTAPPSWLSAPSVTQPVGPNELAVRWLGTAAFEIRTAKTTILIDPHYSRHNLWKLLSGPLHPDVDRIRKHLPKAQAIFVSHSHHDHLVDAPTVSKLIGAPLYGSEDTTRIAHEEGVSLSRLHTLKGGETVRIGDLAIEAVPSEHSHIVTQWLVSGKIAPDAHPPMRFSQYKHGQVFTYVIHWRGRTIYHFGSAELTEAQFKNRKADVMLLCLSGWKDNPGIFTRMENALHPAVVVPMHHDDFFRDLDEGFHPGQLAFVNEAYEAIGREMAPSALVKLDFFQEVRLKAKEAH